MAADLAGAHQKTLGADKNYDTKRFVAEMTRLGVTPHVAQNTAPAAAAQRSMALPPATWATPNRSMPAGESKRYLVGSSRRLLRRSRRSVDCASSNCAGRTK
jgi:hypothetical protein